MRALAEATTQPVPAATQELPAANDATMRRTADDAVPLLDLDGMLDNLNHDLELIMGIADVFLADVDSELEALQLAVAAGEAEAVYRAAHSLRGMVGNFGAGPAVAVLNRLEKNAQAGDVGDAAAMRNEADALVRRLAAEVRSLRMPLLAANG
jgi:HPt (histidine-containing phosphotransfer) domain-containing protein